MAKQRATMRRNAKKDSIFCFCVLIFFIIQWLVFWFYANLNSIRLAFTYFDPVSEEHKFFSQDVFTNFSKFISDVFSGEGKGYVWNGVIMHLLEAIVCLPISYMVAFLIYKKCPAGGFFKVVLYLPPILSGMVIAIIYRYFLEHGVDYFFISVLEKEFPYVFLDERYNWWIVGFYVVFFGIPGALLVNLGTMSRVPNELVEYGILEGISLWKEFCLITVPLMFPVIQVQCLGLFTGFFNSQGPLYTFYKGVAPDNIKTFGYYIFVSTIGGATGTSNDPRYMYGYTSAANLVIGLVSVPIVQLTKMLFDKFDPEAEY